MRLEDVVSLYLPWLYHGYEIPCHAVRVTRDAEIAPQNAEAEDTLAAVESSLRERRMGRPSACSTTRTCRSTCSRPSSHSSSSGRATSTRGRIHGLLDLLPALRRGRHRSP